MKSRYDFMTESKITDIDNEPYPDPLSVSYNDVQLTKMPTSSQLSIGDITKFWLYMRKVYGIQEFDDVLLNINGVPYKGMLKPGDEIFNIEVEDLFNFHTQKLPGLNELED